MNKTASTRSRSALQLFALPKRSRQPSIQSILRSHPQACQAVRQVAEALREYFERKKFRLWYPGRPNFVFKSASLSTSAVRSQLIFHQANHKLRGGPPYSHPI